MTTREAVMRRVERKYGWARRVWVFDRGIVSEENLASLRKRGGKYLVGTPRSKPKGLDRKSLAGGWTTVRDEVEARWVPIPAGAETSVLCRSRARREKEIAIHHRFSARLEQALKSEWSIRPLFHQLEPRVKAHILVAFLGYAMRVTLKHLLRRAQSDLSPAQALALLSTLQSADIVLPTTDGREIRLRRIATPDPHQQKLLAQLGILLPDHFNLNFQCRAGSAIA